MDIITSPSQYNICFSIASLILIFVTLIINSLEEAHDNRQKNIFGMIIFDALHPRYGDGKDSLSWQTC